MAAHQELLLPLLTRPQDMVASHGAKSQREKILAEHRAAKMSEVSQLELIRLSSLLLLMFADVVAWLCITLDWALVHCRNLTNISAYT